MATTEARQLFRYAGLLACAMVTLPVIVDQWYTVPARTPPSRPTTAVSVLELALALGFGLAFWWNTRRVGNGRAGKTGALLVVFQMALSTWSPELAFIVAGQLPLMMRVRPALKWLAAQAGLLVSLTVLAAASGDFSPTESLAHTPAVISVPGTVFYILAWMCFAFGAGYLAASEARIHRDLARANSELHATQALLADGTRASERLRISRELHDVLGQHLVGLSVNLQLASHVAEGAAAEPVREAHLISKLLLAEVRGVVGTLRESRQTDLRRALELLSAGVSEPHIHLNLPDGVDSIDPARAHVLFRFVQEAITNAIRHSGARNLWVDLNRTAGGWGMLVRDDGRGTASILMGNGLKGMAERLSEIGGELKLESRSGQGFTLLASLPSPEASS